MQRTFCFRQVARALRVTAFVSCTFAVPSISRADVLDSHEWLGNALDFAGFELFGTQNPLSGGTDFLATTNWQSRRFDAGPEQITLNGPLSLEVNTGGRPLPRFDVSFQTALNSQGTTTPLGYTYDSTFGGQNTKVDGTLFLDTHFGIDAMGFYDVQLRYSSRQLRTVDGHTATAMTRDADVGPVNVSGNIFVDALAVITDPLFERSGRTNPFQNASGFAKIHNILSASTTEVDTLLANAGNVVDQASSGNLLGNLANLGTAGQGLSLALRNPVRLQGGPAVVPEPTVLIMLLVGAPLVVFRGVRSFKSRPR